MNDDLAEHVEELNLKIETTQDNVELMKSYAPDYFMSLRAYLPELLNNINHQSDGTKKSKILKSVFLIQRELMAFRVVADMSIDDDLWEIAYDFDNDDPLIYPYLLKKIKDGSYLLQANLERPNDSTT